MADFNDVSSHGVSDEELDLGGGSGSLYLPLGFGIVGILLGAVALYFALTNQGQTGDLTETLSKGIAEAESQATRAEQRIQALEAQLEKHQRSQEMLRNQLRSVVGDIEKALNQLGQEMGTTRSQVAANAEAMQELVTKLSNSRVAVAASSMPEQGAASPVESNSEGLRQHSIRQGDTFGQLARQYNVSVEAIIQANPNVNPNRLQIGQVVNIPQ